MARARPRLRHPFRRCSLPTRPTPRSARRSAARPRSTCVAQPDRRAPQAAAGRRYGSDHHRQRDARRARRDRRHRSAQIAGDHPARDERRDRFRRRAARARRPAQGFAGECAGRGRRRASASIPARRALVATMRKHGAYTALVSGGFRRLCRSRARASSASISPSPTSSIVEDGRIAGTVKEPILGKRGEARDLDAARGRSGAYRSPRRWRSATARTICR